MSQLVVQAEHALASCLEAMHQVLQSTLLDARLQSTLYSDTPSQVSTATTATTTGVTTTTSVDDNDMPDTLRQRLEWEGAEEARRVQQLTAQLHERLQQLRAAIMQLGGGLVAVRDGRGDDGAQEAAPLRYELLDVPVDVLDKQLVAVSAAHARAGAQMVQLYDEAERLAAALTTEIMHYPVPPL